MKMLRGATPQYNRKCVPLNGSPMTDHEHPIPSRLQFWMERNIGRPPLWQFPELSASKNLEFQRLHFDNRHLILAMFNSDPDPFVTADFKSPEKLYEYVAGQWICSPYSPKHGAADWIASTRGQEPVGVLHVYEISRETWALNHRRCAIGYAVAARYRGTGMAQEAVRALQVYLFSQFDMLTLFAISDRRNERGARFLARLGYEERTENCVEKRANRLFELHRDAEAREQMRNRFELERP